jgi:hypothetical protein
MLTAIMMVSSIVVNSFLLPFPRKRESSYFKYFLTATLAGTTTSGFFTRAAIIFLIVLSTSTVYPAQADEKLYSLNVYGGQMTTNKWENFFGFGDRMNFKDSFLMAVSLGRRIGTYNKKASFEIEGQVVKHFSFQDHWEFNALVSARWESFWWNDYIDTSVAFGLGPSFATAEPETEKLASGATSKFLVYWMMELALGLPEYKSIALITRIHHRSNAFGLVTDKGGSNALTIGLKYRF